MAGLLPWAAESDDVTLASANAPAIAAANPATILSGVIGGNLKTSSSG
jgi:hypothetical protein